MGKVPDFHPHGKTGNRKKTAKGQASAKAVAKGGTGVGQKKSTSKVKEIPFICPSVALSARDKAPQLKISRDQLEVSGNGGGFRMVRATHGVHNGSYYCEAEILDPVNPNAGKKGNIENQTVPDSHVRIGWSTRQGDLQAPLGHDKHGYAYRSTSGSKVNASIRDDAYAASYGPGDIIGLYLKMDLEEISNNEIRFFKNGKDQGIAYRGDEIPMGVYFPAISVYQYAQVRMNFGPSFILQHDIYGANALSEVQPMNPQDRREHEARIADLRAARLAPTSSEPKPVSAPSTEKKKPTQG